LTHKKLTYHNQNSL